MEVTVKTAQDLRLTADEFELIKQKLGRTPNFTELCAFSAMWSEHCSYKNSIKWLKTLPREGGRMLVKAGEENAGLMDIGDGYGVVFKIESHNHPSALEPFQGAATGVGGIHRDIFTMGARPIAALNSLRFGSLDETKTRHLLAGVVSGIGHYGNCFGVPTVGGEIYFDECYHTNPLVNAMSVGIVKAGETVSATALGEGNPVVYVGSATGKDGIGGASFASADITEESVQELPAVQVGDPFQEKKLLEACLEAIETGVIVGMQDMGAAGIICSTAEMSAKGEVGMRIQLDKVPARQKGMKAWELLLSESQERMLMVVQKGKEQVVQRIFEKWDLESAVIGEVTTDGLLQFFVGDVLEATVPAHELVLGGGAPQYEREYRQPKYMHAASNVAVQQPADLKAAAEAIITAPSIASKRWIYHQYDSMVGTANASTNAASDAAVIVVKETGKALAVTVDCNSRYVYADPYKGAMMAVAEAARNIVCTGGQPLGVTNCLNFGNPYDPEVYYQFVEAVKGMGEACRKLETPVTGGNVSFYNQGPDGAVYPTPTIGMVGLIEDLSKLMTLHFKGEGDVIYLLGKPVTNLGSSEYLRTVHNIKTAAAPDFDLEEELVLQKSMLQLIQKSDILSAHDVSEGGLFTALCESGFVNSLGFDVQLGDGSLDALLFAEGGSRVVVTVPANDAAGFESRAGYTQITKLGTVTSGKIVINGSDWNTIGHWKNLYDTGIEKKMKTGPSV